MKSRNERFAAWTAIVMLVSPILYVLSSGPMAALAWRVHTTLTPDPTLGPSAVLATSARDTGEWWPRVYAPLVWASERP
ncbi:MAG TPA: hypothetical protein VKU02_19705, partial [Gemmataceae bacterium]|nr:hypothetical protein [Gemmataceae bacterium]